MQWGKWQGPWTGPDMVSYLRELADGIEAGEISPTTMYVFMTKRPSGLPVGQEELDAFLSIQQRIFKDLRRKHESLQAMARVIGISIGRISELINGKVVLNSTTLAKLKLPINIRQQVESLVEENDIPTLRKALIWRIDHPPPSS